VIDELFCRTISQLVRHVFLVEIPSIYKLYIFQFSFDLNYIPAVYVINDPITSFRNPAEKTNPEKIGGVRGAFIQSSSCLILRKIILH